MPIMTGDTTGISLTLQKYPKLSVKLITGKSQQQMINAGLISEQGKSAGKSRWKPLIVYLSELATNQSYIQIKS